MSKKRVLLKISGEIFLDSDHNMSMVMAHSIITQIHQLLPYYQFGIVVGGGNFFRGNFHGKSFGISATASHQIGMLSTVMNGLILKDLFDQKSIASELFCAFSSPEIGTPIGPQAIQRSISQNNILIFSGGTGAPFFSTDTAAIVRALQMNAQEVWKGTKVDGVYTTDPKKNKYAQKAHTISYQEAIASQLGVMDMTAYALAQEYNITTRVFNIFTPNALLEITSHTEFGSKLS